MFNKNAKQIFLLCSNPRDGCRPLPDGCVHEKDQLPEVGEERRERLKSRAGAAFSSQQIKSHFVVTLNLKESIKYLESDC